VQNIDEQGNVRPKKLLVTELDEDLAIYENRFICALINRLVLFVEQRYRDLEGKLDASNKTNVNFSSKFNYGDSKFSIDLKMLVEEPPEDKVKLERNKDLFERVENIRRRLRILQATDFMKSLSAQKPVHPPIQKTNLITKNVDYNNCYKLWLFISSYTYLGYSIEVSDKNLPVEGDYYDDLTFVGGLSLDWLLSDNIIRKEVYDNIPFSQPEEKEYEVVTNYTFDPKFDQSKAQAGVEAVNEYYFRQMKDELVKLVNADEVEVEKQLDLNFAKFFRAISRINDEMYTDLIEEKITQKDNLLEKTALEKKQLQVKQQQERLKRRALLSKLKWEELERAQRMQERAQAKLDKLKEELAQEKRKSKKVTKKVVRKTTLRTSNKTIIGQTDGNK
jgi:hypothetical protein